MGRRRAHLVSRLATGACLCAAALSLGGCNYVAAGALIIGGPPKVPAAFEDLPEDRKTIVFVDDRSNVVPRRALRRATGEAAEQALIGEKVLQAEMVLPSSGAIYALSQEKRSDTMSIVDVGKAVGADIVIYVSMNQFTLSRDGSGTFQPGASAFVKVFDVPANKRLWPPDTGRGFPVSYMEPNPRPEAPKGSTERSKAEDELARQLGVRVAQLFYEHKPDTASDSRIDD